MERIPALNDRKTSNRCRWKTRSFIIR